MRRSAPTHHLRLEPSRHPRRWALVGALLLGVNALYLLVHAGPAWADLLALAAAGAAWPMALRVRGTGGRYILAPAAEAPTPDACAVRSYAFWGRFGRIELEHGPRLWLWPDALGSAERCALRRWLAIHGPERRVR